MKIVEAEEENNQVGKDSVGDEHHDAQDELEGNINAPSAMILGEVSSSPYRERGRPRKSVDASSPIKHSDPELPHRGRGRPKKNVETSGVSQRDPALPHRGRGRPPKNSNRLDSITSSVADPELPRRGRGRPKKNVETSGVSERDPALPHRGRGRPRKNRNRLDSITSSSAGYHEYQKKKPDAVKLLANALAKHGRGRPRKDTGIKDAVRLLKEAITPHPELYGPPQSKGPGRPRKFIGTENLKTERERMVKTPPRPRGRPRKALATPSAKVLGKGATPRPRGRPRKVLASPGAALPSDKANEFEMESSEEVEESLSEDEHVKSPVIVSV